jgi:hypothetical protein
MGKIKSKDITVTCNVADGFTLSYITDEGDYYRQRYIGYSVKEAGPLFKAYVREEGAKIFRRVTG